MLIDFAPPTATRRSHPCPSSPAVRSEEGEENPFRSVNGPRVVPGAYTVAAAAGGRSIVSLETQRKNTQQALRENARGDTTASAPQ